MSHCPQGPLPGKPQLPALGQDLSSCQVGGAPSGPQSVKAPGAQTPMVCLLPGGAQPHPWLCRRFVGIQNPVPGTQAQSPSFLSIQASSGASSRADPSQSCGQGCSHGAVLGLGLWGLVEDVGPPSPPQPPSLSIASSVPPWPLDAAAQGSGLPEPPLSLTVDAPSVLPQ